MYIVDSVKDFRKELLRWFFTNGRHWIPWKLNAYGRRPAAGEIISPYRIWIAEVMLQQTQLKVMLGYWQKWMNVFPVLDDLANADEQEVLLNWQGLGYYSRAKRLHKSSKILIEYIGRNNSLDFSFWPVELSEWMALPGLGRSTAGSIISSAFDLPHPILDGNVKRILSRLIASDQTNLTEQKRLWSLISQLVPTRNSRDFNQALMDFGSIVCTVKNPKCTFCPIQQFCIAYLKYDPLDFPKKNMKKVIPVQEIGIALILNQNGELLIDQRLESSSMGGMWEFPGGKKELNESIEKTILREVKEELDIDVHVGEMLLSFQHLYSHKKLNFVVHLCDWKSGEPKALASQKFLWVSPENLSDFPFPAANIKIISALHKHLGI